ncbi:hypothetical protein ACHEVJ_17005 [Enterococcus raffinosus]|nr:MULTISPECIES: hypothetical protein [Enterococcus]MDK7993078.1 hypothetical protein [Enterococcus raffinosus]MDT2530356.1 hypothetical protein [Enterococcus raffinosus]MDT2554758.1 hypothetical protein [Enterococcus raffinosus]MDT2580040.1 hypothetical protein [Enterococcus raffinosus]OFT89518.1 hypothetical protein HMPREF3100_03180 [Enterococcus sp. HMSC29A04]
MDRQELIKRLNTDLGGFYDFVLDDIEISEYEYLQIKRDLLNIEQQAQKKIKKRLAPSTKLS